eukprot:CAMPEP_0195533966 /NCGR_PEP_ID=MMETSP0794_2-20130614/41545_1 /TAXON_ID=515487 /ORGANISM="Stephanopyxis turris, Strain CCMP 815" /LENGTH=288 /DNA_ID=CAMNT_0040666675 /DNA_START=272 /DNA_END=1138 /DNA_ORIENTATION=-
MQNRANEVIDRALSLGVNWFDCARSYGLSEKFVGEYLRSKDISSDDVYVSSKWGYTYVADWNVSLEDGKPHEIKNHSVENFLLQVEETNDNLGEYVNLYQIHSATFDSGVLTDDRVHEALNECKKKRGWSIGLSVSGPSQNKIIQEAMNIRSPGEETRLFDSVQCTFNLLEQKPGETLEEARNAGMDIIIKEGLANGRLLQNPLLLDLCEKVNADPDQLALASILAQPFQPRVLSGSVTADQMESNFQALELSEKLVTQYPDILEKLIQGCVVPSEDYWKERSELAWN